MSVKELESIIEQLPPSELAEFTTWFEEFLAQAWDKQIEEDFRAGRLDAILRQVGQEFESGQCQPL